MIMVLLINGEAGNAWKVGVFLAAAAAIGLLCLIAIVRRYSRPHESVTAA